MDSARRNSVKRALRTNRELQKLFDALGNTEHPRGRVMTAYRVARNALRGELARENMRGALDVLSELRRAVSASVANVFEDALAEGVLQATDDLDEFGLPPVSAGAQDTVLLNGAHVATLTLLDTQLIAFKTQLLAGVADDSLLLGDDGRVGLLSPAPVLGEATRWITGLALAAYLNHVTLAGEKSKTVWKRQAIAALDERTTDCCLRVHGQVVTLHQDFVLTGTPRYANRLKNPPFHWHCRTTTALLRAEQADDELTHEMVDAARAELQARNSTGTRGKIHPANATSRRG